MKVLLVDDDPDDRGLFQDALKNIDKNTEFSYLGDCNAVVDYLNTYTPDIIFLDVHLPKSVAYNAYVISGFINGIKRFLLSCIRVTSTSSIRICAKGKGKSFFC